MSEWITVNKYDVWSSRNHNSTVRDAPHFVPEAVRSEKSGGMVTVHFRYSTIEEPKETKTIGDVTLVVGVNTRRPYSVSVPESVVNEINRKRELNRKRKPSRSYVERFLREHSADIPSTAAAKSVDLYSRQLNLESVAA